MSTAETRAAKRDYWTSPSVTAWCKALDYSLAGTALLTIMILGSLNFHG